VIITPTPDQSGSTTIIVSVSDGALTASVSFVVTVRPVNDPPSFTRGADQAVNEDAGSQTVSAWATRLQAGPPDEAGQTMNFSVSNNNNALFSVQPAIDAVGTLTYTPAPNANGSALVTLSLQDNGGTANGGADTSAPQTMTITVNPVNDPPAANGQRVNTLEDTAVALTLSGSDVEGSALTYTIVTKPTQGILSGTAPNLIYTPSADVNGSDSFAFKVNDGTADSLPATVSIAITPVNDPPNISQIDDQTLATCQTPTVISFMVSDLETPANLLTVAATSGNEELIATADIVVQGVGTNRTVTLAPACGHSGEGWILVVVTDADGNSTSELFKVSVQPTNAPPAIRLASPVGNTEEDSGIKSAVFAVSLSSASLQMITVDYETTNGTATAGSDYTAVSGTLSFSPGQTNTEIIVPVIGDTLDEFDETFLVNLSRAVNASISVGQSLATIVDDDMLPSILITDAVVLEGNSGTTSNLVFQVRLSTVSGKTVSVDYATANGTATAGSAYQPDNGTLTFPPGTILQTVTVRVNGDDVVEPDETVLVNLSNVANATVGRGQGVGKILNDEELPSLTVTDASVSEGDSGTTNAVFTVLLSIASSQTVTVDFATADGTAVAGSDYVAVSRTLSFPAGTTLINVNVQVIGDAIQEPDEFFIVRLTNAVNATLARAEGQGAIRNDDNANAVPTVSITRMPDGQSELQLEGVFGKTYVIETSGDLVNWAAFTNIVATEAVLRFRDSTAKVKERYYRARQGP